MTKYNSSGTVTPSLHRGLVRIEPDLDAKIGFECRAKFWYDNSSPDLIRLAYKNKGNPLREYLEGTFQLSTKQVPDPLSVYHAGNSLIEESPDALLTGGFTLVGRKHPECISYEVMHDGSFVKKYFGEATFFDSNDAEALKADIRKVSRSKFDKLGLEYSDIFKILGAYSLAGATDACKGLGGSSHKIEKINLNVWHGNKLRMTEKIPTKLIPGWNGNKTANISFIDIASLEIKLRFIYERTFWGRKLIELTQGAEPTATWAKKFQRKITFFLEGKGHPDWTNETRKRVYSDPDSLRNRRVRSGRLLEVLKTVNGIFVQRYLAFPNEEWTWSKYDLFTLRNLNVLLNDEFYDGELLPEVLEIETHYSELKKIRKEFKDLACKNELGVFTTKAFEKRTPKWLRFWIPLYRMVDKIKDQVRKVALISTLSQTRGCGTPPSLVQHQSKRKFLMTVQTPPIDLTKIEVRMIRTAMLRVINEIPEHVFTGLTTKARISVTTSACIERSRAEGGTLQAIADLVIDGEHGIEATIIDLNTGECTGHLRYDEGTVGEYIFWRCLEYVLECDPEELRIAYLTIVKEPGKARIVTKGSAYLKIILDVVNKIVSYPLTKIKTSESGMSADAHGWNFFNELFAYENSLEAFKLSRREVEGDSYSDHIRTDHYEDLYVECTDFNNATDLMQHATGKIISEIWLNRCGIPKILKQIVFETSFRPRKIIFNAAGIFSQIGETYEPGTMIRFVNLVTGILMGDPLTKVLLHFTNIIARELGLMISSKEVEALFPTAGEINLPIKIISEAEVESLAIRRQIPLGIIPEEVKCVPEIMESITRATGDRYKPPKSRVNWHRSDVVETLFQTTPEQLAQMEKEERIKEIDRALTGCFGILPGVHEIFMDSSGVIGMRLIPYAKRNPVLLSVNTLNLYTPTGRIPIDISGLPEHLRNPRFG